MKILMIVNPVTQIPPRTIGGTERIVHALLQEYVRAGHEVTLLAEDHSTPPAGVTFYGTGTYWHQERTLKKVWSHLMRHGGRYDVIHNHGRLLSWIPRMWGRAAKIHTWHFGELQVHQIQRLIRLHPHRFAFASCGAWITERYRHLGGDWVTVPNGLPENLYQGSYDVSPDAPLVIIGRMDPRKGIPDAIRIARSAGKRLIIAGFVGDLPEEKAWFDEHVGRYCDGKEIQFIGAITDGEKQALLGQAAGYLIPLQGIGSVWTRHDRSHGLRDARDRV